MMRPRALFSIGMLALLTAPLGGCATSCTGDPRTDSLGCASANLSSGRYDRDTARLAMRAEHQQMRAADARRASYSLERERGSLLRPAAVVPAPMLRS
jgi:hypothetical protein